MWEELIRMRLGIYSDEVILVVSTSLDNLSINFSSELRLRCFKMLWNDKKIIYNFHVLTFEIF